VEGRSRIGSLSRPFHLKMEVEPVSGMMDKIGSSGLEQCYHVYQ
jgi:hypothetical protein